MQSHLERRISSLRFLLLLFRTKYGAKPIYRYSNHLKIFRTYLVFVQCLFKLWNFPLVGASLPNLKFGYTKIRAMNSLEFPSKFCPSHLKRKENKTNKYFSELISIRFPDQRWNLEHCLWFMWSKLNCLVLFHIFIHQRLFLSVYTTLVDTGTLYFRFVILNGGDRKCEI